MYDEEKELLDKLFSLQQHADSRWIELYSHGTVKNVGRKFGTGRVVVSHESMTENIWLQQSELCVAGRPVGDESGDQPNVPLALLPKQSEILQVVSDSPDADLLLADRPRPSDEQIAAQKGTRRDMMVITSVYKHMELPGPSLACMLTGHVEDCGTACHKLRVAGRTPGVAFDWKKFHYLSLHMTSPKTSFLYGKRRLHMELIESWLNKEFSHLGFSFCDDAVALTEEDFTNFFKAIMASKM